MQIFWRCYFAQFFFISKTYISCFLDIFHNFFQLQKFLLIFSKNRINYILTIITIAYAYYLKFYFLRKGGYCMNLFIGFLVVVLLIIICILLAIIFSKSKLDKSNKSNEYIHFKFSLFKNTYAELDYQRDNHSSSTDEKNNIE